MWARASSVSNDAVHLNTPLSTPRSSYDRQAYERARIAILPGVSPRKRGVVQAKFLSRFNASTSFLMLFGDPFMRVVGLFLHACGRERGRVAYDAFFDGFLRICVKWRIASHARTDHLEVSGL